jgi:hypothetical protein
MQRLFTPDDNLSVDFVPEQSLNTSEGTFPCLHWLFGKDGGYVTRLEEDHKRNEQGDDGMASSKAEAAVMREITDWLQCQECDEFWTPRTRIPRRVSNIHRRYA